jgi:hypothetical protein
MEWSEKEIQQLKEIFPGRGSATEKAKLYQKRYGDVRTIAAIKSKWQALQNKVEGQTNFKDCVRTQTVAALANQKMGTSEGQQGELL